MVAGPRGEAGGDQVSDFAVAHHEASHAVAAHTLGIPVTYLNTRKTKTASADARLIPTPRFIPGHELDFAIVLVAATMGLAVRPGARALAQVRWLDAVGEGDVDIERGAGLDCRRGGEGREVERAGFSPLGPAESPWAAVHEVEGRGGRGRTARTPRDGAWRGSGSSWPRTPFTTPASVTDVWVTASAVLDAGGGCRWPRSGGATARGAAPRSTETPMPLAAEG